MCQLRATLVKLIKASRDPCNAAGVLDTLYFVIFKLLILYLVALVSISLTVYLDDASAGNKQN